MLAWKGRGIMTIRILVAAGVSMTAALAGAETVRVTPLGTHHGEYCLLDRAMLFEDPTGVRILYDPGRTTWEGDGRLGTVHAVLLSHMHADHVGEVRPTDPQTGTCAAPSTVSTAPESTTARIVAAKDAMFIAGGEMSVFMTAKVDALEDAPPACITTGLDNETTVPSTNGSCTAV